MEGEEIKSFADAMHTTFILALSILFHTISKVHNLSFLIDEKLTFFVHLLVKNRDFCLKNLQKSLIRVTYFLQIRVGSILQILVKTYFLDKN